MIPQPLQNSLQLGQEMLYFFVISQTKEISFLSYAETQEKTKAAATMNKAKRMFNKIQKEEEEKYFKKKKKNEF